MGDKQKTHTPLIPGCVFNGIWSAADGLCVLVFDMGILNNPIGLYESYMAIESMSEWQGIP
jgi:hypothetical protein